MLIAAILLGLLALAVSYRIPVDEAVAALPEGSRPWRRLRLLLPRPTASAADITDARLRQIAIGVRSRHDHITGVTAAEVTEMAVALARQRGIELRSGR